jgi:ribose transport system substrate-binding protein
MKSIDRWETVGGLRGDRGRLVFVTRLGSDRRASQRENNHMKTINFARLAATPMVVVALAVLQLASAGSSFAAANCIKGEHKPPFKIGWANIYSIPTWMKETTGTIEDMANTLKKQGLVDSLTITDAQGNANTQIQQIQSMIDAKLDAIIVDAGSATALDRVIADACSKGIAVTNFDSLVDTKDLTTKIDTDQNQWGKLAAEWLVKQLNGKGNILVLNGPAGVSVSDDRRKGAEPVFKANPGIKILAETNTPYNAAPAQEAVTNLLFSNPQIDGVWSQGGALSAGAVTAFEKQGRNLVPITGENYRPFLEMWKQKKLTAWATQQPNWLAAFAVYAAVKALQGNDIPAYIDVPLPIIDESNLDSYLSRAKDFAADGYIYSPYDTKLFDELIAKSLKK